MSIRWCYSLDISRSTVCLLGGVTVWILDVVQYVYKVVLQFGY
jgi:hypothetical protein